MPSREREQRKSAEAQIARMSARSTATWRKTSFELQPWYAGAARKISAARKPADMHEVPEAPLAPD
jgi:hypothetical protein